METIGVKGVGRPGVEHPEYAPGALVTDDFALSSANVYATK